MRYSLLFLALGGVPACRDAEARAGQVTPPPALSAANDSALTRFRARLPERPGLTGGREAQATLVRDFVTETLELAPLATTGFLVPDDATSGGWGANFIVEWAAEEPVHEPVIEALMVSTAGTQGLSLISPGRVLSQTGLEGGSGADEQP